MTGRKKPKNRKNNTKKHYRLQKIPILQQRIMTAAMNMQGIVETFYAMCDLK